MTGLGLLADILLVIGLTYLGCGAIELFYKILFEETRDDK